jgi:Transglycosylase SLT domain
MSKLFCRLAVLLLLAWLIMALAGADQVAAGTTQEPAQTNEARAETNPAAAAVSRESARRGEAICPMIEAAARANGLPVAFFTRVIWQESRFRPDEVGPVTRSGQRAQGIAQFMPGTAAERGLLDPFNPVEALPKSGKFLTELRDQFGNLGLAAAAYNVGPQRVRDFLAGLRGLPLETRRYVHAITGRPVEYWAHSTEAYEVESQKGLVTQPCSDLVARLKRPPARVLLGQRDLEVQSVRAPRAHFAELQRRVPSWCRHLHQPKVSICGSVHQ